MPASRDREPGGRPSPGAAVNTAGDQSRRERKKSQARDHMYQCALRLFRSRGYDQTTVQDIADAADTAKGTFFAYFPTKEHVLVEYHQRMGREILAAVEAGRYRSAEAAIQAALRECAGWTVNDPVMGRLIIRLIFASDLLLDSDEQNEARLAGWLTAQIEAGRSSAELKQSLDISLFLSLLMGTLSSTVIEWLAGNQSFDLEGRVERKVRFLFDGARASSTRARR